MPSQRRYNAVVDLRMEERWDVSVTAWSNGCRMPFTDD